MTQMGLRAAMAFALLGLGGAAIVPGFGVYDIFALAGGSVAAGGIFALDRRRYLESRAASRSRPSAFSTCSPSASSAAKTDEEPPTTSTQETLSLEHSREEYWR